MRPPGWLGPSSYHHRAFPAARIAAERKESVTVCVPARDEAETIGAIVTTLVELREAGVVDQVLVADSESVDGAGKIACDRGAEVVRTSALLAEYGPVVGKSGGL